MAIPRIPAIETMNVSEARRQFSETLDRVRRREARVIVEKSGIPVGAVVSMEDLERIKQADANRVRLFDVMDEISRGFDDLSDDEIEAEVERAIAEVEAERRERRERASLKALLTQTRQAFADIPLDEIERTIEREIAEVDAELAAERQRDSQAPH
jgi:prevent-host-death family protein